MTSSNNYLEFIGAWMKNSETLIKKLKGELSTLTDAGEIRVVREAILYEQRILRHHETKKQKVIFEHLKKEKQRLQNELWIHYLSEQLLLLDLKDEISKLRLEYM